MRPASANAAFYDTAFAAANLGAAVRTPHAVPGSRHIYNQYIIRAQDRDKLRQHLAELKVGSEIYYPVPPAPAAVLRPTWATAAGRSPIPRPRRGRRWRCRSILELNTEQLRYVVDSIARFYCLTRLPASRVRARGKKPMTSTPGPLTPIWGEIAAHESRLSAVHTHELFVEDPGRYARFSREALGLSMDFSRQRIDQEALYKTVRAGRFRAPARSD